MIKTSDSAVPEPRTPGEIIMNELFRHFVSKSSDKIDLVLSRPLFPQHHESSLKSNHDPDEHFACLLKEGADATFDDLLRSLATTARESRCTRQVIDLIVSWGSSQGIGAEAAVQRIGDGSLHATETSRMTEVVAVLNEKRVVSWLTG